jgi:aminopeptidase N/puromycin-sensitive aminopeptidase
MQSFVTQPGVPMVAFGACSNNTQTISQSRFHFDPAAQGQKQTWVLPVCTAGGKCVLLDKAQGTASACAYGPRLNANGLGYYRADYVPTPENLTNVRQASQSEQTWFLDNEWALTYSGRHPISAYLDSARAVSSSRARGLWDLLDGRFAFLNDFVVTDADRPAFNAWVQTTFKPVMKDIGWDTKPSETAETKEVRDEVFFILGVAGRDPDAIAKARQLTDAYMQNPDSVDPNIVETALRIAAENGDAKLWDAFHTHMQQAKTPGEHYNYLTALERFRDPALLERTLQLAMSDEVRSQDTPRVIGNVMRNGAGGKIAWEFVRTNFQQIKAKSSVWSAAFMLFSAGNLCSTQANEELQQFYQQVHLPAAERGVKQAVERNADCARFRDKQQPALAQFLQKNAGGTATGAALR